jgi:hypothetical protein
MSVSTNQNRFSSLGDGVNDTFNFPSYFKSQPDILVLVTDDTGIVTTKVLDVDYSINGTPVAGFGYKNGADIVFAVAPLATDTVILINDPTPLQNTVLAAYSAYPPQKIESTLDSIILIFQRVYDMMFSRTVVMKDGMVDPFDPTLPIDLATVDNQGKVMITDPAGSNTFVMGPSADDIENAQQYAADAAASAAAALASENVAVAAAVQATESAADVAAYISDFNEVDTSGGDVPVILPLAIDGKRIISYINKLGSAFNIDVTPSGGDTIHGDPSDSLGTGEVGQYWSNGTDTWYRIN